jgi:murein L,D-transpeptidase YafK
MIFRELFVVVTIVIISLLPLFVHSSSLGGGENVSYSNKNLLNQPVSLVDVAPRYGRALIAELELGKLHIFELNTIGQFDLLKTIEISIGKEGIGKEVEGDNKTPIGVYRIESYLTQAQLDDFYGHAAYPINYPNASDRLHQRTGHGIWLHGEPMGNFDKIRPFLDSNGCIVMSNNEIDELRQYLDVGYTYIVSTPKMKMTSASAIKTLREKIYTRLYGWEKAWESKNSKRYLSYYSTSFNNLKQDFTAWSSYKKRVNGSKRFIDVSFSDVGIYAYPNEENLYWVEFYQSYRSSNFKSSGWKRQMWRRDLDGELRIIYEGGG